MGSTSLVRSQAIQLKGPSSSLEGLDVYCFGHLLFEMSTGCQLKNPTCDNGLPNNMDAQLSKNKGSLIRIVYKLMISA